MSIRAVLQRTQGKTAQRPATFIDRVAAAMSNRPLPTTREDDDRPSESIHTDASTTDAVSTATQPESARNDLGAAAETHWQATTQEPTEQDSHDASADDPTSSAPSQDPRFVDQDNLWHIPIPDDLSELLVSERPGAASSERRGLPEMTRPRVSAGHGVKLGYASASHTRVWIVATTMIMMAGILGVLVYLERTPSPERPTLTASVDLGPASAVSVTAFSNRDVLVVAATDGSIDLVQSSTGRKLGSFHTRHGRTTSGGFSPDGRVLAIASSDGELELWDVTDPNDPLETALIDSDIQVTALAINPDGKRLVLGRSDGTSLLFDIADPSKPRALTALANGPHPATDIVFSPDGKKIAAGVGSAVQIWDAGSGEVTETLPLGDAEVTSVAFSPDAQRIATGDSDNNLQLWDVKSGHRAATLFGHTAAVTSVAFSPDGRRIVSGSEDRTVRLWDAGTGQPIGSPLGGLSNSATLVTLIGNGTDVRVLARSDGTLLLWESTK